MNWIKKGLVYKPAGTESWSKTHAQVPVADIIDEDTLRIYFATRDSSNKSRIGYIEVNSYNPKEIKYIAKNPLLELGNLGSFDEDGTMPACIINEGAFKYLYYIGWSRKYNVPYHNSIGMAISEDGGKNFRKFSEGPILGQSINEPYFTGTCCILKDEGIYRMYYLSCLKWEIMDNKPEPFYDIKYAESMNGINWKVEGKTAIGLNEREGGLASATVIKENNIYKMLYSFRGKKEYRTNIHESYRIGYAESKDGVEWIRLDHLAGINISENGWDSGMVAYPNIIKINNSILLFYNGNGFGKSGFGYAILK